MAKLIPKNEAVLRAVSANGTLPANQALEMFPDFDVRTAIVSLRKCNYIEVVGTVIRKSNAKRRSEKDRVIPVHVYGVTEKGRLAIQYLDYPPVLEIKAATKKALAPKPKQQELHPMQYFTIPDRDPNVREMVAEIDGREVKITYGINFKYEVYKPAPDLTRYKPMPIRGIHAL